MECLLTSATFVSTQKWKLGKGESSPAPTSFKSIRDKKKDNEGAL